MSKAFIDTTILTDILLKPSKDEGKNAKKALDGYENTELPVYAIKEFKAGPLQKYIWLHNKFVETESYNATIDAIKRVISFQPRRASTALEAISEVQISIGDHILQEYVEKYGKAAKEDFVKYSEARLALHFLIKKAWKKRRKISTSVVNELTCYEEVAPFERRKMLEWKPVLCKKDKKECCMAEQLREKNEDLKKLREAIDVSSTRAEDNRRRKILKELIKHPNNLMTEEMCKDLGDAVFAFFAPQDATILTTNMRDHGPLAKALGKEAKSPQLDKEEEPPLPSTSIDLGRDPEKAKPTEPSTKKGS